MPTVDPNRFRKDVTKSHRQLKKVEAFKLNQGAIKDFMTSFPGITSLKQIHKKLKTLRDANHLWYSTRLAQGKISETDQDAVALGTGTNLEDVKASGFKEGKKTERMNKRTTGIRSIG